MAAPVPVPEASFLGAYVRRGAFADCYRTQVAGTVSLAELVAAFYTTPLFRLERRILSWLLKLPSTDQEARELAAGTRERFAAWTVELRAADEILLDAGQTRSWLAVAPGGAGPGSTALLFGSAVVPRRSGGGFGWVFHALVGFHRLYSKLLLRSAARRLAADLEA